MRYAIVFVLLSAAAAHAQHDRYFLYVFSSQSLPYKKPHDCHTWATAVRLTTEGALPGKSRIDEATISWMPATLKIRWYALRPEMATNLTLDDTIQAMLNLGHRISQWGPYEIPESLYRRFIAVYDDLNDGAATGRLRYRMIEAGTGKNSFACVNAVRQVERGYHHCFDFIQFNFGDMGSHMIVKELLHKYPQIDRDARYPQLEAAMGLERYPIERLRYVPGVFSFREHAQ